MRSSGQIVVNAEYVRPDEITSWQDLLEPRFTGRMSAWDPTVPGTGWFPYLRFYSPTDAFFDKTWKPDDIVEMK